METDYRNIPKSELNSNIPQGRGMIKWAPFATMPEQYEKIDRMMERQQHVPPPSLNEDLQQELELKLKNLKGSNVILRYWDSGYEVQLECAIEGFDNWSHTVMISKNKTLNYIDFNHIYSVDRYDYFSDFY